MPSELSQKLAEQTLHRGGCTAFYKRSRPFQARAWTNAKIVGLDCLPCNIIPREVFKRNRAPGIINTNILNTPSHSNTNIFLIAYGQFYGHLLKVLTPKNPGDQVSHISNRKEQIWKWRFQLSRFVRKSHLKELVEKCVFPLTKNCFLLCRIIVGPENKLYVV